VSFLALSIATFVVSGAGFALVERLGPWRGARGARPLGAALRQDLPYVLLSNALPGWLVGAIGALLRVDGPLRAQHVAVQWLVVLGITELTFYAVHRAFHRVPALWPLHAAHHTPVAMDWLAGFRKHAGEAALHGLVPLPLLIVLGPAPEVMLFHTLFGVVFTGLTHVNATLPLGWLDAVVITPRVHAWHHGRAEADQRRNLGGKLALFDRLLGTWNPTRGWPGELGLEGRSDGGERWWATHRGGQGGGP